MFSMQEIEKYKKEDWYKHQRELWNELKESGWSFRTPQYFMHNTICIEMVKGSDFFGVYIPRAGTFKEIHTKLLNACRAIINDSEQQTLKQ